MIRKGNYDLAAEFLHSVKPLKSPAANLEYSEFDAITGFHNPQKYKKSRNLFPLLKSEYLTMVIFSYYDVHHRSLDLLKRLNSKGYDIFKKQHQFKHMFEVFLKSQIICANIRAFEEDEIFSQELFKATGGNRGGISNLPSIIMVNIDLYCDGNYPRGLSVLYQIDGHKSIQLNYVGTTTDAEVFRKDSIALNHNEYVT